MAQPGLAACVQTDKIQKFLKLIHCIDQNMGLFTTFNKGTLLVVPTYVF